MAYFVNKSLIATKHLPDTLFREAAKDIGLIIEILEEVSFSIFSDTKL